eukprot:scaffold102901_cov27-Phaeocystis_antarctica.AAC.1
MRPHPAEARADYSQADQAGYAGYSHAGHALQAECGGCILGGCILGGVGHLGRVGSLVSVVPQLTHSLPAPLGQILQAPGRATTSRWAAHGPVGGCCSAVVRPGRSRQFSASTPRRRARPAARP